MNIFVRTLLAAVLLAVAAPACPQAPSVVLARVPVPDARYKADILVVVAHPDDDTGVSTYLAKAVLDDGKRVAVIFTNRGNAGPNAAGLEQSKALADVREIEARRSLAARGITNVWFLRGQDTPTQDVLHSLETLGHGEALEETVRLIRLTRPEVIITWLPAYVAGENHGDHQAAGVVAVEAFDLTANPTAFPEQVTAPRYNRGISNYGEGLRPWQPQKLYFFSDASHPDFLKGHGPAYLATDISPAKHVSFAEINREAWKDYATQLDFDDQTLRSYTDAPEYLILGKSLVQAAVDADVMAGVSSDPIRYTPRPAAAEPPSPGISLTLGGPWSFYQQFYRAHDLGSLAGLVRPPQTALGSDRQLWVPLLLRNSTGAAEDVTLRQDLPAGWTAINPPGAYHLEPGETWPVELFLTAPDGSAADPPQLLRWTAWNRGESVGSAELEVYPEYNGVPQ
ncbi:MAG TPA: PIG-L family deacetylase [Acidobacteriaceae bacterium]|jgi:LmbE family N-acetylglucosaminyl deacetylase|nr:PIG-L family deacetylase [Acidobacteriaceae bacterium]